MKKIFSLFFVLSSLLLAGCGSDGPKKPSPSTTPTTQILTNTPSPTIEKISSTYEVIRSSTEVSQ